MGVLEEVKALIGIKSDEQDGLINTIISLSSARLKTLIGGAVEVPEQLSYVLVEVAVRRFNRIGSEGLQSHSVEGESMTWPDDDFKPYYADLERYKQQTDDANAGAGRVVII